ncbi:MAG: LPS-assembly protein LptD [Pyrinomonadaceae bacterium]|nr:LPS-assembly protein LptD [Pyrinomonadaceae bacterium]
MLFKILKNSIFLVLLTLIFSGSILAQETNPVDKQVANPLSDEPNVKPILPEKDIRSPQIKDGYEPEGGDGDLVVYSDRQTVEGEEGKRIVVHEGNVDARYGIYRMQADKITIYEAKNLVVAEGSVIFDQGEDQRITGSKGVWNYKTKLGNFTDSTGFTNQTEDGSVIYFRADRVERVALNETVVENAVFTACEDAIPNWSFTTDKATIKTNDKIKLKNAKFRLKNIPIIPVPFASIPIKEKDRSSGFLTPSIGFSGNKGLRISAAYYQTLGRSADVTFRGDLYSARGFGYGADFRTRANSRSFFNFGFFAVQDRLLGPGVSPEKPDQGGSIVYAEGVQYFQNGFTAVADVRITSSLAFRQVFSDGIQQVISPIEVSKVFLNKSWNNYTMNILARSEVISIPNVRVKTKNLPSINFDKRPAPISFFRGAYFSFKTSLEGVSRREEVDDLTEYRKKAGSEPVVSPSLGQRFDFYPKISIPFNSKYVSATVTAGARVTYYSNSFDDFRQVISRDVIRKYGEFELDIRPVALARNFYDNEDKFKFRHVIEPFLTYRYIKGIDNFDKIIRFDFADTKTDTNEIEYGITNRFYTRRYTEAVTEEAQKVLNRKAVDEKDGISIQPYEIFTLTVRGKYYADPYFGGALTPGRRNQIDPITSLTPFTFGGVPRRFSPVNVDATYRPQRTVFFNSRMDLGVQGGGLRNISATVGYEKDLFKFFQTFYYTRAVTLIPSLQRFSNEFGKEAGTLRGSQWSPSLFVGNRNKGFYGGTSLFFDFQNRRTDRTSPLISSLYTLGYASDCCASTVQFYTYNVGVRRENRLSFSFRLNGIGTFGSEQFGQGLRD